MQKTEPTLQLIGFFFLGIILFSCNLPKESKNSADQNGINEIKIDLKKNRNIDLSDFADQVEYIKLETTEKDHFNEIQKIVVINDGIFVLDADSTKRIYRFSSEGELIATIGKIENSSGELMHPSDFFIDEIANTILIVDQATLSVYTYTFTGDFVQRVEFGEKMPEFVHKLSNGNYFVKFLTPDSVGVNQFGILNPEFKVVNEFLPSQYPFESGIALISDNPDDNSILFSYGYADTIYQYTNESIAPKYAVNYGDARIPDEKRKQGGREMYPYLWNPELYYAPIGVQLIDTEMQLFFTISSRDENYICCYNKQQNESALYYQVKGAIKEVYSNGPLAVYNENLVFSLNPNDISEEENNSQITEKQSFGKFSSFEEVQKNTYAEDNPILVLMKPKSVL